MSAELKSYLQSLPPEQLAVLSAQNHDVEVYVVASVFSALAILAVLMRVTSRHMKKVAFGYDDGLIVAALVIATAQTIFICIGVRNYKLGWHIWTLSEQQVADFNKLWYTVGTLQCSAQFMTKTSLLILLYRIFVTTPFRMGIKIVAVVNTLWWIATILADTLICIPASHLWDPSVPASCGNLHLVAILPPIPWIATDVVLLLMPVTMVWKLHLPALQRIGLACLFLLGGFSTFASCFRYSTLFYQTEDITWTLIPATIWTIIELDITIITVCLIVSRPWFMKLYPKRLVSYLRSALVSTRRSSGSGRPSGGRKRHPLFSSFRRLDDRPPAVTAVSMGVPFEFEFDLEKKSDIDTDLEKSGGY